MSSISGLPIKGSDVKVFITQVHAHPLCVSVEFWAKFRLDRTAEYEHLATEIQAAGKIFQEFEGNPGDQCLAKVEGIWYRSRIVSRNGSKYKVFLFDQGTICNSTTDQLSWGQKKHFFLPPEVEFCVLANVLPASTSTENKWTSVALDFLKSLCGRSALAYVQDVLAQQKIILLHVPCISNVMYEMGFARKLSPEDFKDFMKTTLQLTSGVDMSPELQPLTIKEGKQLHKHGSFLYTEHPGGTLETVIVTEVRNPGSIFCQLKVFSHNLKKLSVQLNQYCEGKMPHCVMGPESIGCPCAARGINGKWYRSTLLQVFPTVNVVEVLNVDYGSKQFVKMENIRSLTAEFLKMPVCTYLCSLSGVICEGDGWTSHKIDYLRSLLLFKTLFAKFEEKSVLEGIHYVTLYQDDNTSINNLFNSKEQYLMNSVKKLGDFASCLTTYSPPTPTLQGTKTSSPGLAVEDKERKAATETLQAQSLPLNYSHMTVVQPVPDRSEFGLKTRAQVETAMPPTQHSGPQLSGMSGNSGASFLTEHPVALPCNRKMFKEQMFQIGSIVDVTVSHIKTPQDFWCQLTQTASHLESLMHEIQAHYSDSESQPVPETACIARHPDNGMWYRAIVIHRHDAPQVDVLFIDYGHTETVALCDLRRIHLKFVTLPGQAFRCSLLHPTNPTTAMPNWTKDAVESFQTFVATAVSKFGILKCTIYAAMHNEQKIAFNIVDLETPFESVLKSMADFIEHEPPKMAVGKFFQLYTYYYSTHNVRTGTEVCVTVTCVDNISHFYCQLEKNTDVLKDLQMRVGKLCLQLENVKVPAVFGTLCFAKYSDGHWYRGQIMATKPRLLIHFVDFGDVIQVARSDLLPVPREANDIVSVPVQAMLCGLSDVPASVPSKANSWFEKTATECKFRALVVAREPEGRLLVELYHRNVQINAKLKSIFHIKTHAEQPIIFKGQRARQNTKYIPDKTSDSQQVTVNPEKSLLSSYLQYHHIDHAEGQQLKVYVSSIVDAQTFWCQSSDSEELDKITSSVAEVEHSANQEPFDPNALLPGSPCIALYSSDQFWYRAEIIDKEGEEQNVLFVDYGNKSKVNITELKAMPHTLVKFPPQAFLCELEGFDRLPGSWDSGAADELATLTSDKLLNLTVNRVTRAEEKIKRFVHLECEGLVINEAMKAWWKCLTTEDKSDASPYEVPPEHDVILNQTSTSEDLPDQLEDLPDQADDQEVDCSGMYVPPEKNQHNLHSGDVLTDVNTSDSVSKLPSTTDVNGCCEMFVHIKVSVESLNQEIMSTESENNVPAEVVSLKDTLPCDGDMDETLLLPLEDKVDQGVFSSSVNGQNIEQQSDLGENSVVADESNPSLNENLVELVDESKAAITEVAAGEVNTITSNADISSLSDLAVNGYVRRADNAVVDSRTCTTTVMMVPRTAVVLREGAGQHKAADATVETSELEAESSQSFLLLAGEQMHGQETEAENAATQEVPSVEAEHFEDVEGFVEEISSPDVCTGLKESSDNCEVIRAGEDSQCSETPEEMVSQEEVDPELEDGLPKILAENLTDVKVPNKAFGASSGNVQDEDSSLNKENLIAASEALIEEQQSDECETPPGDEAPPGGESEAGNAVTQEPRVEDNLPAAAEAFDEQQSVLPFNHYPQIYTVEPDDSVINLVEELTCLVENMRLTDICRDFNLSDTTLPVD